MNKRLPIIIAEAGVNHNGSLDMALQLVRAAAKAGADYVKFQTFRAESLVGPDASKAEYQKANCPDGSDSQLEMLRGLELTADDFAVIAAECRTQSIGFVSTPFDLESVDILAPLGMDFWKIPSGEITNLPLLRKIGALGQNIVLSTGMCTLQEVEDALVAIEQAGTPRCKVVLLHCTTQYPAPYESVNLRAMDTLAQLGCGGVGYSDHTEGIAVTVAATALGAVVIEKHFTLDRSLPGPDHRASLTPPELNNMICEIRRVRAALGNGIKEVAEVERTNIAVARKSIVAKRAIKKGELFTADNLTAKRPGTGLSPMLWDQLIGQPSPADFPPGALITLLNS